MGESMSVLDELYREIILKHYQAPKNFGVLPQATRRAGGMNPSCGDQVEVMVLLEGTPSPTSASRAKGAPSAPPAPP
jgi:NifU homolog involved in Fe-S cluster formation